MRLAFWAALWFAIPLAHSNIFVRPYQGIKELVSAILMLALVVITPGRRAWPARITGPGWVVLALVASLLVSALGSDYKSEAFARTCLDLILIAWGLWWFLQPDRPLLTTIMIVTLVIVTAVTSVSGFRSILEHSTLSRFDPIGHRYYWAEYLVGVLPILMLHPRTLRPWWPALAVTLPGLALLIMLGRRMPILGLIVGLGLAGLVFAWTRYQRFEPGSVERRRFLLRFGALVGAVALFGGLVALGNRSPAGLTARLAKVTAELREGDLREIDDTRVPLYEAAPGAILARPLGYGRGSYPLGYFSIVGQHAREPWSPREVPSYHPYNAFLHLAIEGGLAAGIAGVALFVWVTVGVLRRLLGKAGGSEYYGLALLAGLVALGCDSLTFSAIEFPLTRLLLVFYVASAAAWIREARAEVKKGSVRDVGGRLTQRVWVGLRITLALAAALTLSPYYYANHKAEVADSASKLGATEAGIQAAETAIRWNPSRRGSVLVALKLHANNGQLARGIAIVEAYIARHPDDAIVRIELAKAYFQRSPSDRSAHVAELEKALEWWPASFYALERLGDLAREAGEWARAESYYAAYFTHYPTMQDLPLEERARFDKVKAKLDHCQAVLRAGG